MTHKDKLRTGYSKKFADGWKKIQENDPRIKCKNRCGRMISNFQAKHNDGMCRVCAAAKKRK
ncbi:MAG: hypothetical protein U9O94_10740 [Nanoarchaeota archaeon]|nr:hypothetical protein [Nanoarchaeota archaeon]